ncbi:hypothetical protein [Ensifer adhaerens]|uniref:hypothetical protein n=1 Tax=Ensifer adhaerens TaxID=106592 RepID=UPI000DC5248F|nr:hypothetical protein [Ensifer adhaerens]RAS04373.1 DNA-binding SARP family transcriptional activator [Ensifer adhaerens]
MSFHLQTFGALRLVDPAGKQAAYPEKGLLLLAYLLTTEDGTAPRNELAKFLWGDEDNSASLTNLRKMITRLKSRQDELNQQFFSFINSTITVDRTTVTADLLSLVEKDISEPFGPLANVVKLLNRTFLGTVNCHSPDFQAWLKQQRNQHNGLLRVLVKKAARLTRSEEQTELLREALIILASTDQADADILQLIVKVFEAEGEIDHLRRVFERRGNALARGTELLNATVSGKSGPNPAIAHPSVPAGALRTDARVAFSETPYRAIPRLVLLPPNDQVGRPEYAAVGASVIEDITIGFCAFNSLQVIAHHSAVQLGHRMDEQVTFFESHSLRYVLDTRISGHHDDPTFFVQLIFMPDNEVIWAERFSLGTPALVETRRIIARSVALSVSSEIDRYEATRTYRELHPVAYHHYLTGRRHLSFLTLPNLRRARKEMKAALQATADFAPALSSIARTYSKEWLLTARGDIELLKAAEMFSVRAIEAHRNLADGYRELGVAKLLQGDFDESAEALELAETLSPHYADVIADHADTLVHCSLPSLALQKIERAIELNPLSPDSYLWTAAGASYALSNFETSLGYIKRMADPSLADRLSAASWAMLGNRDKAHTFVRRVREANPNFDLDTWLAAVPSKEQWHRDLYREGLKRAGF